MKLRRTGGSLCSTPACKGVCFDGPGGGDVESQLCETCYQEVVERLKEEEIERKKREAERIRLEIEARHARRALNCPISELEDRKAFVLRAKREGFPDFAVTGPRGNNPDEWSPATLRMMKEELQRWLDQVHDQRIGPRRSLASEALAKATTTGQTQTIWVGDEKTEEVFKNLLGPAYPGQVTVRVGSGNGGYVDPYFPHAGGRR